MAEPAAPTRVFVVGCPRSGTTLLQSMLASHPAVLAFPETHVLWGLQNPNRVLRRAGLRRATAAETWGGLATLGVPVEGPPPRSVSRYVRQFAAACDAAAVAADRTAWSEKTPGHLRSLDLVARFVPDAHVVHVVRHGVPAVTSLYAVTRDHGCAWNGHRSVALCLTRWRNDLNRTASWAGRPRQHVVSYERLVADPEVVLGRLVARLGLPEGREFIAGMLGDFGSRAAHVTLSGESWKAGVAAPLSNRNTERSGTLDVAERTLVEEGVAASEDTYLGLPFV